MTLIMRPYRDESDLPAIADLLNACEAVDKMDEGTSVTELQMKFNTPSVDKERDLRLWEDGHGKLIGFSQLRIPENSKVIDGFLRFRVHPNARAGNLEKQIIFWGEERMRKIKQECNLPAKLRSGTRGSQTDRVALLEHCGFTTDRAFFTMTRPLTSSMLKPQFPVGFTLRHIQGEEEVEAWVDLHNQSFIDHWNHHDTTVERQKYRLSDPEYRPELDLIAIAPDGTFAAHCFCDISLKQNERTGRNEGWIHILGTRQDYRRIGLGRAILLTGMHQLYAFGADTVKLGVDTQNRNCALQLYESVGFRQVFTRLYYVKDI